MSSVTLRELSRRYATGDIDRDTYRRRRRALIEDIVAGNIELLPYQPPEPDTPTVFPYDDDDGDTTQEIAPPLPVPQRGGRRRAAGAYALMGAVIIVTGLVAWWFTRPAGNDSVGVASPVQRETSAETELLENFLSTQPWAAANLNQFAQAWAALDPAARARLRDADAKRRLAEAILEQIATENALIGLGDTATALEAQRDLLDFAARLGISDPRLDRAQEEWAEAERRHTVDAAQDDEATAASERPVAQ
ncbi:MAG: hypothetical protein WD928_00290 [Gammaproteobacteria bacterium]